MIRKSKNGELWNQDDGLDTESVQTTEGYEDLSETRTGLSALSSTPEAFPEEPDHSTN